MSAAEDVAPAAAPGLTLTAPPDHVPAKRCRSGYLHPLVPGSEYERVYARGIRSIKNWLAAGRAHQPAPDLPPLDDVVAMVDWWQRVMTNTPPTRLLELRAAELSNRAAALAAPASPLPSSSTSPAGASPLPATPPRGATPAGAAAPSASSRPGIDDFATVAETSLDDAIRALRQSLTVSIRDYKSLLADPDADESRLTLLGNRVDKAVERLRRLEQTSQDLAAKRGDLISRADLTAELSPLLDTFASSLVNEVVDKLGHPRPVAVQFVDDFFALLRDSRFLTEALPLPAPLATAA